MEGALFLNYCTDRSLLTLSQMSVCLEPTEYLGGLADLTGELGRVAVNKAAQRDAQAVQDILQVDGCTGYVYS